MSNNAYMDGELNVFIQNFSGKFDLFEGSFLGVDFRFRGQLYRITRSPTLDKEATDHLKNKFNKSIGEYEVIKYPVREYGESFVWDTNIFIGLYDTIEDLLNNCLIDGVPVRTIVTSNETVFLGTD